MIRESWLSIERAGSDKLRYLESELELGRDLKREDSINSSYFIVVS